ncbi:IS66 family insertion sequence element accessory protein TnpB [Endozoicomonas sp. YOMI1]|uniref:IS66 family insertion sequence element accessory protein TnpB n=1 Tax=Endozoicomonas sp. YOMI1 TaxID=2828739 RepID=UPI002148D299|nr:IS66 family insertion sequence element accessory protein TnpB [Endozoicomonas sp. YOMI1]
MMGLKTFLNKRLHYKSLADDKFHWPKPDDELVTLTGQQLNWLLDGYNLNAMKPHKKSIMRAVFSLKTQAVMVK